ncbi:MAG: hypothetical protein K8S98_16390 [Planctomycetes bacterium]|nr:hypothetical protein [Planctomycetota bacterium]
MGVPSFTRFRRACIVVAAMRVLVFGNSGSGKSHLARRLLTEHGLAHLDLDTIAWAPNRIAVA